MARGKILKGMVLPSMPDNPQGICTQVGRCVIRVQRIIANLNVFIKKELLGWLLAHETNRNQRCGTIN